MVACITCSIDIPPVWKACINNNICPQCNGPILNDDSKAMLDELREAMTKMPNDPEGLAGWLLSNYKMIKVGTAEPTEFHRSTKNKSGQELKINNNPVHKFLERSGMAKEVNKTNKLAELAQKIQSGELDDKDLEVESFQDDSEYDEDNEMPIPVKKISTALINNSSLVSDAGPLDDNEITSIASAVESHFESSDGQRYEQLQRIKRLQAQQTIDVGGKNSFKRVD